MSDYIVILQYSYGNSRIKNSNIFSISFIRLIFYIFTKPLAYMDKTWTANVSFFSTSQKIFSKYTIYLLKLLNNMLYLFDLIY